MWSYPDQHPPSIMRHVQSCYYYYYILWLACTSSARAQQDLLSQNRNNTSSSSSTAHMCMITAPRDRQYVLQTLSAVEAQIKESALESRLTLSLNVAHNGPNFLLHHPLATPLVDRTLATGPDCVTNEDTDPLPPCGVRQQGLDVANALAACHCRNPAVDWLILFEDDFMPCGNQTLTSLLNTLDTLDPHKTKFARFTQGSGGVAFPSRNVPLYTQSVLHHIPTTPYDRVLLEPWSLDSDYVFPRHLFKHIGRVSTMKYRNTDKYVKKFARLRDNECGSEIKV